MTRTEGRRGPDLEHQELQINGRKDFFFRPFSVFNSGETPKLNETDSREAGEKHSVSRQIAFFV